MTKIIYWLDVHFSDEATLDRPPPPPSVHLVMDAKLWSEWSIILALIETQVAIIVLVAL